MGSSDTSAMKLPEDVLNEIMRSATLLADLGAMADCGGRLAGSQSEQLCHRWLMERRCTPLGFDYFLDTDTVLMPEDRKHEAEERR